MKRRHRTASCSTTTTTSSRCRLKVPCTETEWNDMCQNPLLGAYEQQQHEDDDGIISRPFASSSVLIAMQPSTSTTSTTTTTSIQRGISMPLLQPLRHLFHNKKSNDAAEDGSQQERQDNDENHQDQEPYDNHNPLNNSDFSTLTIGHHQRYLQLLLHDPKKSFKNANTKREFQTLRRLIKTEQDVYRTKLQEFINAHIHRYKNYGIPSLFAEYKTHVSTLYQEQLLNKKDEPAVLHLFGTKCRQVLSLLHVSRDIRLMHAKNSKKNISTAVANNRSIDEFASQVVWNDDIDTKIPMLTSSTSSLLDDDDDSLLKPGTAIMPPVKDKIPAIQFLRNDQRALELCRQYNVDVLTTQETLQTLLQLPGDESVQWRIPAVIRRQLVILELPLPGPSNPRQCLTDGVQEGLYQQIMNTDTTTNATTPAASSSYSYSLLTLPNTHTTAKQSSQGRRRRRVLVRTQNRIVESATTTTTTTTATNEGNEQQQQKQRQCRRPVRLLPKLEYFCDYNYQEIHTSYDKSLWILEKILQPSCRVLVVHVDPSSSSSCQTNNSQEHFRVASTEQVSVAHALAGGEPDGWIENDNDTTLLSPMDHLEAMTEVLQATQSLPSSHDHDGRDLLLLLQLSAGATSVSVHTEATTTNDGALNVCKLLEEVGGVVYTGPAALRQCVRPFQWNADAEDRRVPYTFPPVRTKPSSSSSSTTK
jgi:hypothetical protein